jgi:hypothetical protein
MLCRMFFTVMQKLGLKSFHSLNLGPKWAERLFLIVVRTAHVFVFRTSLTLVLSSLVPTSWQEKY